MPNEMPLYLATADELLSEFVNRRTMAAIVIVVKRELREPGETPEPGDPFLIASSPVFTKRGTIGMMEMALGQLKADPRE